MPHLICVTATLLGLVGLAGAQERITQADLLLRVIDVERLTRPPGGEHTSLHSSMGADGAALSEDGWQVLARADGAGAITRMWFARADGEFRLVLDGQVVVEAALASLLSGDLPPFEEPLVCGGTTCYLPIGFRESCRVLRRDSSAAYQVSTVAFPPGTEVQRFALELDDAAQAALADVRRTLNEGYNDQQLSGERRLLPVAVAEELGPGDVLRQTVEGAGTVRAMYVALTDRNPPEELYALRRCVLRVFVDGDTRPSVEAPLCEFFGAGFDLLGVHSLLLGTDAAPPIPLPGRRSGEDRFMYCLFPMAYRDSVQVEIENFNLTKKKIGLLLLLRVDGQPPAPDALRFHARYRHENPCRADEYVVLEAGGGGRLVGCVLSVDCPRAAWWGTGADKVWLDGARAPSYVGADTASYFGQFGGLELASGPLQGVTRTGAYGKTSAYRVLIGDCISFRKSLRLAFGNQQALGARDTYYSSVAYWYAAPGAERFFKPLAPADLTPPGLRIPNAVEVEDNIRGPGWGTIMKQKYAGGVELSNEEAANITTGEPVEVNIPSSEARTVLLKLRTHPRRPFETVTVRGSSGNTVGTITYDREAGGLYVVGEARLERGSNWLTVQCSRPAVLDCWILQECSAPGAHDGQPVPVRPSGK